MLGIPGSGRQGNPSSECLVFQLPAPEVDSGYHRAYYPVAAECFRQRDERLDSGCGNHRRTGVLPGSGFESR